MMKHTDILPSRKSSWKNDAWNSWANPLVVLGRIRNFVSLKKNGILDIFRNQIFGTVFDLRKVVHSMPIKWWSRTRCSGWRSPQSRLSLGASLYRSKAKAIFPLWNLCFELLVQLFCDHPRSCCPSRAWWADLDTWPKNSVFWDWSKPDANLRIPPNANPQEMRPYD